MAQHATSSDAKAARVIRAAGWVICITGLILAGTGTIKSFYLPEARNLSDLLPARSLRPIHICANIIYTIAPRLWEWAPFMDLNHWATRSNLQYVFWVGVVLIGFVVTRWRRISSRRASLMNDVTSH